MSSGRVFQSLGPATASDQSPTVTSRDREMTSSEEVDDRFNPSSKKSQFSKFSIWLLGHYCVMGIDSICIKSLFVNFFAT